jgi:Leucine-rich repeat (LRR) protein
VLDCGGEVVLKVTGKATPDRVRRKPELPKARFDVVMIDLDDRRSADDSGLAALEGLKELSSLNLSGTSVTDTGAAVLGRLSGLKILALRKTQLTDRAVRRLKDLESLRDLDLQDTKISPSGVEQLRTALPACHITPP